MPQDPTCPEKDEVISGLRAEHTRILYLLHRYEKQASPEWPRDAHIDIVRAIRTHLTVETGLLVPALVDSGRQWAVLQRAGREYARILSIANEIECSAFSASPLITQLRTLFIQHADLAEANDGLFCLASRPGVAWPELARQIAARRDELSSAMNNEPAKVRAEDVRDRGDMRTAASRRSSIV